MIRLGWHPSKSALQEKRPRLRRHPSRHSHTLAPQDEVIYCRPHPEEGRKARLEGFQPEIHRLYIMDWPVFSQSARNAANPLSVRGCWLKPRNTSGGTVTTSEPASAACFT